jgi:hypothetical protein
MDKLAALARKYDATPVLLFEYAGIQISGLDQSRLSWKVIETSECAAKAGVTVIDSYEPMLAQYHKDQATFWDNWVDHPTDTVRHNGHMSKQGNQFIANLIADRIRSQLRH